MGMSKWPRRTMVVALVVGLGSASLALAAAATEDKKPSSKEPAMVESPTGLKYQDLVVGTGTEAKSGDRVRVHYTGWLDDGTKFDSSLDRGTPFQFRLGAGMVIAGWDEGVAGMKVGGKRRLVIPPGLAYKDRGAGGVIPPNATLTFEVELLDTQPGK